MKLKRNLLSISLSLALSATAISVKASAIDHVLLISVDGLHQSDLDWFVKNNPNSTLAAMVNTGVEYNNAQTPFPSDSFPGMVGQATGGSPATAGVYYDDGYSRALLPLGTTKAACMAKSVPLGAEVQYAENIEPTNGTGQILLDANQGIPHLYPILNTITPGVLSSVPSSILKLAGAPNDVRNIAIDPAQLPVDPKNCKPLYPHQYLPINTIFEVARAKGMHTAWTDKHPAYEILNGPSGAGIDDLFAPEINSVIDLTSTVDWTKDNVNTQKYDTIKVRSIINEINGFDHSGKSYNGTPAIFGMNFQVVSTAQKLNMSYTPESPSMLELGGYTTTGSGVSAVTVPGPVVQSALKFVDASLKQMQNAIDSNQYIKTNTAIIVSAKHGQSPINRSNLTIINDGTMISALNTAWHTAHPTLANPLVAHAMDDDGILLWLNDRTTTATNFVTSFLNGYNSGAKVNGATVPDAIGSDINGNQISKSFTHAGIAKFYAGSAAATYMGVDYSKDQRVPDIIGIAQTGSVYGGSKLSKIAEHGGGLSNDRHVPIVISGAGIFHVSPITQPVKTIQIAPTILHLLGLEPRELQAVVLENTPVLPGL